MHQLFVCRGPNRTANRLGIRRAVRDDRHAADAEQRRTAVFRRIEPLAHRGEIFPHQQIRQPRAPIAAEHSAQTAEQERRESFHRLERDVAGKAVRDDDVRLRAVDIAALDVPDVVHVGRHLLEHRGRGARVVVALRTFLAVGENPDARTRNVAHMAPVHAAHHGELHEVDRLHIDICARVDQQAESFAGRHQRRDRRPIDVVQIAEDHHRRRHHGARISGADECARVAALDEIESNVNRRTRLGQHRLERRVVHQHDFGRVFDSNRQVGGVVVGEFMRKDLAVAHHHDLDTEVAGRQDGALNGRLGGEITPHRVERDFHGRTPRALFLYLGQLAAAVGATMAADAMRHHGLAARRAGAGIDGPERIMRAAHVFLRVRTSAFGCLHDELLPNVEVEPIRCAAV